MAPGDTKAYYLHIWGWSSQKNNISILYVGKALYIVTLPKYCISRSLMDLEGPLFFIIHILKFWSITMSLYLCFSFQKFTIVSSVNFKLVYFSQGE